MLLLCFLKDICTLFKKMRKDIINNHQLLVLLISDSGKCFCVISQIIFLQLCNFSPFFLHFCNNRSGVKKVNRAYLFVCLFVFQITHSFNVPIHRHCSIIPLFVIQLSILLKSQYLSVAVSQSFLSIFETLLIYFRHFCYFWFVDFHILNICDTLRYLVLATFWRLFDRLNAYEYMLTFFSYLPVVSIRLYELAWHSNGSVKCQTLEWHSNG